MMMGPMMPMGAPAGQQKQGMGPTAPAAPMVTPIAGPQPVAGPVAPGHEQDPRWLQMLQSPGMMGLLGAGTSMLGASGRPGGLGEALGAGVQGGLGGVFAAKQAQKEEERDRMLMDILGRQGAIGGMGALQPRTERPISPATQQQPAGLYGAY